MPKLYLLSSPIGNDKDISLRSIELLQQADLIIGEEFKTTSKLLKKNGITKDFELLNEHSTQEDIEQLIQKISSSKITCLFSDAGTPLIEDPGIDLVSFCLEKKIEVDIAPGPSALISGLVLSGFPTSPFTFIGFFDREEGKRKSEILHYLKFKHTIVFFETPYRYKKVVKEIAELCKFNPRIFLGLSITGEDEYKYYGRLKELSKVIDSFPKAPPVIVIEL